MSRTKELAMLRAEQAEPGPEDEMEFKSKETFEMALSSEPKEIIAAAQRAMVKSMLAIISDMKTCPEIKAPGLTWEQLEYFIAEFGKKQPKVITQEEAF